MISAHGVSKYYGAYCAVRDLNFEVQRGECVGFLGLNGAGKSTVLRMLSCLLLPTSGTIAVDGLDVVENAHRIRKLVGYLPENPPLYAEMKVSEYLDFAGGLRGLRGALLRERCDEALRLCGLVDFADTVIGGLSHGYRQRVGIAQSVIHRPALLILDEPLQGLDPAQVVEIRKMIARLRGDYTILLSTHFLAEIEQTCNRILLMHQGTIVAEGAEHELARRYGATTRVEIEVRGGEAELRAALAPLAGLDDLQVSRAAEGVTRAQMSVAEAEREAVSRAVVQAGLGLLSLRPINTGLESIFIQLSADASVVKNASSVKAAPSGEPAA